MSWYADALTRIKLQRREVAGRPHLEQRKYCADHYPYNMRSGYAYRAWLEAMRDEFGRARADLSAEKAGQMDLLGGQINAPRRAHTEQETRV